MFEIKEDFNWLTPEFKIVDYGKNTIRIKGVALRGNDVSRNNRIYIDEELNKAARSWIGKPITINHNMDEKVGTVDWMEYENEKLEYLGTVNKQPYVNMLRNKSAKIRGVSVEAAYLRNQCTRCGKKFYNEQDYHDHMANVEFIKTNVKSEPHGIAGQALSLVLSPEEPGVTGTTIELMETWMRQPRINQLFEMVISTKKESEVMMTKINNKAVVTPINRITVDRAKQIMKEEADESQVLSDEAAVDPQSQQNPPTHPVLPHDGTDPEEELADTDEEKPVPVLPTPPETKVVEQDAESEKDEHGCLIGTERWDGSACVPLASEQPETKVVEQDEEPAKDEHGCLIGKERWDGSSCVPLATEQLECPEGFHLNADGTTCVADEEPEAEETVEENPESQLPIAHPVLPHVGTDPEEELGGPPIPAAVVATLPPPPEVKVVEITLPGKLRLGEPFGGYVDHADCVSKNQDKDDPDAYCASIKQKTEKEPLQETIGIYKPYVRDMQIASAVNKLNEALAAVSIDQPKQLKRITKFLDETLQVINKNNAINMLHLAKVITNNHKGDVKRFKILEKTIKTGMTTQTNQFIKNLKEFSAIDILRHAVDKKRFTSLATDIATRSRDSNKILAQVAESTSNQLNRFKKESRRSTNTALTNLQTKVNNKIVESTNKSLTDIQTKFNNQILEATKPISKLSTNISDLNNKLIETTKGIPELIVRVDELKSVKETFEKLLTTADDNVEERDKEIKSLETRLEEAKTQSLKETTNLLTKYENRLDNIEDKIKPQFKSKEQRIVETDESTDQPFIKNPLDTKKEK